MTQSIPLPFPRGNRIAGLDEAGRGPLAGPVVAAAVVLPERFEHIGALTGLNDSKKLTAKRRDALALAVREHCEFAIGIAEPHEIDRRNILHASLTAMVRALNALPVQPDLALVDGNHLPRGLPCRGEAIVGGDGLEPAISAASIIAKTVRDRIMTAAEQRFPGYGFSGHKGYPSAAHKSALDALGPSPIHRLSYAPVQAALEKNGFARRFMNPA